MQTNSQSGNYIPQTNTLQQRKVSQSNNIFSQLQYQNKNSIDFENEMLKLQEQNSRKWYESWVDDLLSPELTSTTSC